MKKFWETLDQSQLDKDSSSGTSAPLPPVPKPRSQMISSIMKTSEDHIDLSQDSSKISSEQQVEHSETSSMLSDCKQELKDDDSMAVEERLEDESYPISDKIDSDFYDIKGKLSLGQYQYTKDDSFDCDSIRDRDEVVVDITATKKDDFSIYKTKEREDILDDDELDVVEAVAMAAQKKHDEQDQIYELDEDISEDGSAPKGQTSFYIGESSGNIITKSTSSHIDSEEKSENETSEKEVKDNDDDTELHEDDKPYKSASTEKSIQDTNIAKSSMQLDLQKSETNEYTENYAKITIDNSANESEEHVSQLPQRAAVIHSPVKPYRSSATEIEKSVTIQDDAVTMSKAQITTNVRATVQSELDKLNESFVEMRSTRIDSTSTSSYNQSLVEQTFAEVQESLEAVHEDLIDAVQGGRQIKESPSEFEFKVLPNIRYPSQLESHEEEILHSSSVHVSPEKSAVTVTTTISSVKPESDDSTTKPLIDEDKSSNEDSLNKLEVIHRKTKNGKSVTNRWSVSDPDNYSSSGSHYESFERTDSRPCSSDVENLLTYANSSEYQTAQDASLIPGGGSTEYHTAAGGSSSEHSGKTISSHESMKSLNSESSGHLGSVEHSEASETLVPSTMDADLQSDFDESELKLASLETCGGGILFEEFDESGVIGEHMISPSMKRSQEMTFKPYQHEESPPADDTAQNEEKKLAFEIDEYKYGSSLDESAKFGTSLEDGNSILSMSLSSTSNIVTIVDNQQKDEMASSIGSSLIGSYEMQSLLRDDITAASLDEHSLTEQMTMSFIKDGDELPTATSVTMVDVQQSETIIADQTQTKRTKGHKRTDSTSFLKSLEATKPITSDISLDEEESSERSLVDENAVTGRVGYAAATSAAGGGGGSESDSDYDRYETEYARSFKQPTNQAKKKGRGKVVEAVEAIVEPMERKISLPSIETIVEDVIAETDATTMVRAVSQNMQDYSNIPDITITDDPQKLHESKLDDDYDNDDDMPVMAEKQTVVTSRELSSPVQYAHESEFQITEEQYEELIDKQYSVSQQQGDIGTRQYTEYADDDKAESPTSDSFEMIEQPDISDEFVIIEEVAKEADEFDQEGKSVSIRNMKYVKKHDDEVETLLVKSAPANTNEGSIVYQGRTDMAFEFEESPPDPDAAATGNGAYDPNCLDSSKKWVEMQLAEQAQNLRYPYDMDRGILEDIKEEDTDLEVGSSRISSFKDSFSSSPDFNILSARKYMNKEHDDMSVNSLQEFENLEQAISLENRKMYSGSQDSLSNGSFPKRYVVRGQGDDLSQNSLKEFEGLENACIEAHLIEAKAKEEAALLLSRSDESSNSDRGSKGSPKGVTVTTTTTKTTVVSQSTPVKVTTTEQRIMTSNSGFSSESPLPTKRTVETTVFRSSTTRPHDDYDDDGNSNVMEVSSDSLDMAGRALKSSASKEHSHYGSTDSLEQNKSGTNDIMTSSIDSIEISKDSAAKSSKSSKSDVDSLEQLLLAARNNEEGVRSDSIDSIEMQYALMAQAASNYERDSIDGNTHIDVQTTVTTSGNQTIQTRTITQTSSNVMWTVGGEESTSTGGIGGGFGDGMSKDMSSDSLNVNQSEPELLLTSTESLDRSSSVATNATYHNENESQMSGSMTSCGSNTLIDTMDSQCSDLYQVSSSPNFAYDEKTASSSSTVHRTQ